MNDLLLTPHNKAREVNQNPRIYGTFAEIGAGQEVARFFFQAGKASQTIAKTMSAYDMTFSDEIYGKEANGRYVCESRLLKMLDKEYGLLHKRLDKVRGGTTTFFAFADTVATGDTNKRQSHGWLGVRFQTKPGGAPSDVVLHIRLLDRYRLQQQEALGILGVNLVHAAFYHLHDVANFIPRLVDNIKEGQLAIDMIRFTGPETTHINNHLMNLELVRRGLADAVLFAPDQSILTVSDTIWGRPLIIERGHFRPITVSHMDLLAKGISQFKKEFTKEKDPLVLFEITMHALQVQGKFDEKDFLDRVRSLTSLGHHVLVSNFHLFYRLKNYLRLYTAKPIALIAGASLLGRLFAEEHYQDLEGGILEGLGKLLDPQTHLYVYPSKDETSCMTSSTFHPQQQLEHLYQHFRANKWVQDMAGCEETPEFVPSDQICEMIRKKNKKWETLVPPPVRDLIKKEGLFGFLK